MVRGRDKARPSDVAVGTTPRRAPLPLPLVDRQDLERDRQHQHGHRRGVGLTNSPLCAGAVRPGVVRLLGRDEGDKARDQ